MLNHNVAYLSGSSQGRGRGRRGANPFAHLRAGVEASIELDSGSDA